MLETRARWIDRLWDDVRYAARLLRTDRGFATAAVLSMALGIGATVAVFSIVDGVLLRPLPYRQPEQLVSVREIWPRLAHLYPSLPVSARHFREWRRHTTCFEAAAIMDRGTVTLSGTGEPERLDSASVSAEFFDVFAVRPSLGRFFLPGEDEEGNGRVAVISNSLWRRRFSGEPSVLRKTIALDSVGYTVIGVLPAAFRHPISGLALGGTEAQSPPDVYRPKVVDREELSQLMGMANYAMFARLKAGTTRAQAESQLNGVAADMIEQAFKSSGERESMHAAVLPLLDSTVAKDRPGLLMLLGAVGVVLLIICVNLANLALARAERRRHESAVRVALGASQARLLRQALTESLLVAFLGGGLGAGLAAAALSALVHYAPADLPRVAEVRPDSGMLLFALALTTGVGLFFGLAPAWRTARVDPQKNLRSGGRGQSAGGGTRLREALVTAEVCLGTILLIAGGLLTASFVRVLRSDMGFEAPTVLAADIAIPIEKYSTAEQRVDFYARTLEDLASKPGVEAAGVVTLLPLQGETWIASVRLPGDSPATGIPVNVRFISPDYLRTMGIPLLAGRPFSESDRGRKTAIISASLAEALWPGQDPVGRTYQENNGPHEVIGIARDIRADADKPAPATVFHGYWDWGPRRVMLVARAKGDPGSIAGAIRNAVRSADPDVPVPALKTMREILAVSVAQRRFQMLLVGSFSLVALVVAIIGVYGMIAYAVARRTNEIGIRMALGAQVRDVYAMVLRQGMRPVSLGLVLGVAGAIAASRSVANLLYGISPNSPLVIGLVAALLLGVALAACAVPARRAARVDPTIALRYE
jgi:predicted permease